MNLSVIEADVVYIFCTFIFYTSPSPYPYPSTILVPHMSVVQLPEVVAFSKGAQEHRREELHGFMVVPAHANLSKLRADACEALRLHYRRSAAVPLEFLRRYSYLERPTKCFTTRAYKRVKEEYHADMLNDFRIAGERAYMSAVLRGESGEGVAEEERAKLRGYKAILDAAQDSFSAQVNLLPKLLSLDEEISACSAARKIRVSEEAREFQKKQRAHQREVALERRKKAEEVDVHRKKLLHEQKIKGLHREEKWLEKACARSERVLTNYVNCLLSLGVSHETMIEQSVWSKTVMDGLNHAYGLWCSTIGGIYGEFVEPYAPKVYAQLWQTIQLTSAKVGEELEVSGYVDGAPLLTTVHVPTSKGTGFCALLCDSISMHYPNYPGRAHGNITFFKMDEFVRKLIPFKKNPAGSGRLMKEYEDWHARVARAPKLPWHLIAPKRKISDISV